LDPRPVSGGAAVGVAISLFGLLAAPQAISSEWHILVVVVFLVLIGVVIVRRRE